jgi:hypothetical protein
VGVAEGFEPFDGGGFDGGFVDGGGHPGRLTAGKVNF